MKHLRISEPIEADQQSALTLLGKAAAALPAGVFSNGLLTILSKADATTSLRSWSWLIPSHSIAIATTGLGDVFFFNKKMGICFLEVQRASYEPIDPDIEWFLDNFLDNSDIRRDVLREPLVMKLIEELGPLRYGECFILEPWQCLGGIETIKSFSRGALNTYLTLVSQTLAPK